MSDLAPLSGELGCHKNPQFRSHSLLAMRFLDSSSILSTVGQRKVRQYMDFVQQGKDGNNVGSLAHYLKGAVS